MSMPISPVTFSIFIDDALDWIEVQHLMTLPQDQWCRRMIEWTQSEWYPNNRFRLLIEQINDHNQRCAKSNDEIPIIVNFNRMFFDKYYLYSNDDGVSMQYISLINCAYHNDELMELLLSHPDTNISKNATNILASSIESSTLRGLRAVINKLVGPSGTGDVYVPGIHDSKILCAALCLAHPLNLDCMLTTFPSLVTTLKNYFYHTARESRKFTNFNPVSLYIMENKYGIQLSQCANIPPLLTEYIPMVTRHDPENSRVVEWLNSRLTTNESKSTDITSVLDTDIFPLPLIKALGAGDCVLSQQLFQNKNIINSNNTTPLNIYNTICTIGSNQKVYDQGTMTFNSPNHWETRIVHDININKTLEVYLDALYEHESIVMSHIIASNNAQGKTTGIYTTITKPTHCDSGMKPTQQRTNLLEHLDHIDKTPLITRFIHDGTKPAISLHLHPQLTINPLIIPEQLKVLVKHGANPLKRSQINGKHPIAYFASAPNNYESDCIPHYELMENCLYFICEGLIDVLLEELTHSWMNVDVIDHGHKPQKR